MNWALKFYRGRDTKKKKKLREVRAFWVRIGYDKTFMFLNIN